MAQRLKHLPTMRQTWVPSLGWEDPLEKEMATHSSILAWKIPWTEEPGGLQRVEHNRATSLSHTCAHTHQPIAFKNLNGIPFIVLCDLKFSFNNSLSVQFSSVVQSCPTLCNPMDCSTPGPPVHCQLLDFT